MGQLQLMFIRSALRFAVLQCNQTQWIAVLVHAQFGHLPLFSNVSWHCAVLYCSAMRSDPSLLWPAPILATWRCLHFTESASRQHMQPHMLLQLNTQKYTQLHQSSRLRSQSLGLSCLLLQ
mmetsp:Transcript_96148/g.280867  ORF Transcript_96148/g.280867 Transcript_96148/m.280867 type:complete len:121 (-) Transcript_96148:199-561(-)